MDYRVLWKDENEAVKERYYLAMDRISQITRESTVEEPVSQLFYKNCRIYPDDFRGKKSGRCRRME